MSRARTSDTSLQAYQNNQEQFQTLKQQTRVELEKFFLEHRFWPTYNELQKFMIRRHDNITWRTQIQPRLTNDLVKTGQVARNGKRECHVSQEKIQTWKVKNQ